MNARTEWLEARRAGLGGSDAAAALGLSKWKTPYALWREKRGEGVDQEENEAMRWGTALEPVIRQQYAERTGRVVRVPQGILLHPEHAWMLANVDGVTDDKRLLEVKTARTAQEWGEPGTDQVPQAYLLQVQHYMAVTALPVADVAVLIGGSDFRLYEVPADAELQAMLIEGEAEFWQRVLDGIPPEPVSITDMQLKFGRFSREARVIAGREVVKAVERLRELKAEIDEAEARVEPEKALVMEALGEADTLVDDGGNVLCTWRAAKPAVRLDAKALQAAHPDIYSQFLKAGEISRRFLLK